MASTPRQLIIGILLASIVIMAMSSTLFEMADNYGVTLDGNFSEAYDALNDSMISIGEDYGEVGQQSLGNDEISADGGEAGVIISMYKVIKLPFVMVEVVSKLIVVISSAIGLPTYFVVGVTSILLVIIVLMILSAIVRKDV